MNSTTVGPGAISAGDFAGIGGAFEHGGDLLFHRTAQVDIRLEPAATDLVFHGLGEIRGGRNSEIRLDQGSLQLFDIRRVHPADQGPDIGGRDSLDARPEAQPGCVADSSGSHGAGI